MKEQHKFTGFLNQQKYSSPSRLTTLMLLLALSQIIQAQNQESNGQEVAQNTKDFIKAFMKGFLGDNSVNNHDQNRFDSILLGQTTNPTTIIDYNFNLFDQFLQGFKATTFSSNFYTCSSKMRLTANQYNQTTIANKKNNVKAVDQLIFSYTTVLSTTTADAVGECYTTGYNVYSYFLNKFSQFNNGFVSIMEAFLQNLLGNAITFNNLYNSITAAQKSNNTMQVYFQIGRLLNLILIFDPIEDSPLRLKESILSGHDVFTPKYMVEAESISTIYAKASAFGFQFLNQSVGTSSPNSSICNGNITVLQRSIQQIRTQVQFQYYDQMGKTLKELIQTTGPLTYGCYYSLFEYYQIVGDYFSTVINIDKTFYNVVHNLGKIYDNTVDIVDIFRKGDPTTENYWKNLGYYFGDSLNQVFYKPENYDPYKKPTI